MSDDDLIRRGDVLDLFVDWWLYAPSGQQVTGDVCDAVAAIPAVTPATDHEALLKWLDSFPPPNEKLRQMWAEYQKAIVEGRLVVK